MDVLDFDDIAAGLAKADATTCQIHFLISPEDAEERGEEFDTCYALSSAEFPDTLSWVEHRAQPFENMDIPRILFVDPEGTLLRDPRSYAVNPGDFESLLAKLENSHTQLLDTGW